MKHIIKVASLSNLPSTRPLVAMDNNGNLGWEAGSGPEPGPTLLTATIGGEYGVNCDIQFEENMTWEAFANSEYNTYTYESGLTLPIVYLYIEKDNGVYSDNSDYNVWLSGVSKKDLIEPNGYYEWTD